MRRPADRQTKRRNLGGDPREICNQHHDPGAGAGVSQFLAAPAILAHACVARLRAGLTHLEVRSPDCSSGAFAWTVWRLHLAPGVA